VACSDNPVEEVSVVQRPIGSNRFEFVVVSALRAAQLMRGCTPRVASTHKLIMTAQIEVAAGLITTLTIVPDALTELPGAVG
jgi:DNA-directed RNA polymerase subunit K/omega